jgi:hypothetical protein
MKQKHIFISVLDISELFPFSIKEKKKLQENFEEQERAKKELNKFIKALETAFKEDIFYVGFDVIGEKSYERFMFKGSGFLEFMVEAPVAMNAHFPDSKRAKSFCIALKKVLKKSLPKGPQTDIFVESIEVQDEKDDSLKVKDWNKIKDIRS